MACADDTVPGVRDTTCLSSTIRPAGSSLGGCERESRAYSSQIAFPIKDNERSLISASRRCAKHCCRPHDRPDERRSRSLAGPFVNRANERAFIRTRFYTRGIFIVRRVYGRAVVTNYESSFRARSLSRTPMVEISLRIRDTPAVSVISGRISRFKSRQHRGCNPISRRRDRIRVLFRRRFRRWRR